MDFTEKRLAAAILVLAALAPEQRSAEASTAAKVLGELQARANNPARMAYSAALLQQIKAGETSPEPWLAFIGRGPGKPPPAVELLRPAPDAVDPTWWAVFKAWTGPGQMYNLLVNGEMPGNALNDATKAVTLGVANAAVKGAQVLAEASMGKALVVLGLLGGGAYYYKNRKRSP